MLKKLIFLLLILLLPAGASERERLVAVIDKINSVKEKLALEKAKWTKEKQSLEAQIKLFKTSVTETGKAGEASAQKIQSLKEQKQQLSAQAAKLKLSLNKINSSLNNLLKELISHSKQIPSPLSPMIKSEMSAAEKSLSSDDSLGKISSINDLVRSYLTLQKGTHQVKEIIHFEGKEIEVKVIYLGTYIGYFLTADEASCGRIILAKDKWQVEVRPELLENIKKAFSQMSRQGIPELVQLPVGAAK